MDLIDYMGRFGSLSNKVQTPSDIRLGHYLIQVSFHNGSLCNGDELLSADVVAYHHGQHSQQFLLADLVISIKIIHSECKVELFHPCVQLVLFCALLYGSEVSQNPDKVFEVNFIFITTSAFKEECMDNSITKRIDGKFWNS